MSAYNRSSHELIRSKAPWLVAICLVLLLSLPACATQTASPATTTPTPAASRTPRPSPSATPLPVPSATRRPTATIDATHTPTPIPLTRTLSVPNWVTFNFPADWVRINGSGVGFMAVANRPVDANATAPPDGAATFTIVELRTTASSPLAALEEFTINVPPGVRNVTDAQLTTVNRRPAATLSYEWSAEDGFSRVTHLTAVQGPHDRFALLINTTAARDYNDFAPVLQQIASTVNIHPLRRAPELPAGAQIPATYTVHPRDGQGFQFATPPDWVTFDSQGLVLASPATANAQSLQSFAIISPLPVHMSVDAALPQLLDALTDELLLTIAPDAVRISEIATFADQDQEFAAAYFHGTLQDRQGLMLLRVQRRGVRQVFGLAYHSDSMARALTSDDFQTLSHIVNSITVDIRLLPRGGDSTADWSPDGRRLVFSSTRQGNQQIYTMSVGGGDLQPVTSEPNGAMQADYAPDGRRIAYVATETGNDALVIYDLDARQELLRYVHPQGGIAEPDWSPDGLSIVFSLRTSRDVYTDDLEGEIYRLDVSNIETPTVHALNVDGGSPVWSPDGSRIAFLTFFEGQPDLAVMSTGGDDDVTGVTRLTTDAALERYPTWSPDGSRIAFVKLASSPNQSDLYTVAEDGSDVRRLTDDSFPEYAPSWSPDGARILFDSNREGLSFLFTIPATGGEITRLSPPAP